MSNKHKGHGVQAPAPEPDTARVEHFAAPEPETENFHAKPVLDDAAITPPFVEPFDPPLPIEPVTTKDVEIAHGAVPAEPHIQATAGHEGALPEGAVMCEALRDVIVRVMVRSSGARFWLMQEDATERAERGDIKIL